MNALLEQWVIYDHPRDHPEHIVLRRWTVGPGGIVPDSAAHLCTNVDVARAIILANYPEAYPLDPSPEDDPTIIEVWI